MDERRRKIVFFFLTALLTVLLLELVSVPVYRWATGVRFSYSAVWSAQRAASDPETEKTAQPHLFLQEDVLHPFLGFVGDPASDPEFTEQGFWSGVEPSEAKRSPGKVLVGIFGGSLAADLYEVGGDELRKALAENPRWAGREIVLVNTAYGGYKEPQQLMTLAWILSLGGELDVLINLDGFNEVALDPAENAHQGVYPAYPRGWALRVEDFQDPRQVRRIADVRLAELRREALARRFHAAPWRYSTTSGLIWTLLDRRAASRLYEARRALQSAASSERRFLSHGPPRPGTDDAVRRRLVDVWVRGSVQLARLCEANGIRYIHALQPNQYDEGSKPLGDEEVRIAFDAGHPYREGVVQGYPLLRAEIATLRREGVDAHDLTGIFAGVEEPLYSDTCCHLNPRGYALLAEAIAKIVTTPK